MGAHSVTITAADGYPLDARLVEPKGDIKGVLMINSGTGIPKEFYSKFASYVAERDYAAIVYDYRGIGGSRPETLAGFEATMRDWGEKDMVAVLDWLTARYPDRPKYLLGHSVGGQLVGLMPNHRKLSGIVMVAVSTGYWRWFPPPFRYLCAALWYAYVPLTTTVLGYLPARKIRMGENLPKGIAREWAAWCRKKDYMAAYFGSTIRRNYYSDIQTPIRAFAFEDDAIANRRTVPALLENYRNAPIESFFIRPSDVALPSIGHLGFFSSKSRQALWHRPLDWIDGL